MRGAPKWMVYSTNGVEPIWTKHGVAIRLVFLDFKFCNIFAANFLHKLKS